ncbi:cyclodeaminase/cyclohydrolase family protein [Anaeropeptidivorans aminofermentans]|jgi:formiminotetrahydrofolate cyclodeaminase|uniref:cyclodeaminase/cyclohydrolase family protein n=1 Tax=Anaeropeptidivorans aminofermentans TaxID=2934315 RepID=UPI00202473B3|nr:cyclodeaminase/cyclohydrolase family protein [Anaeropeptidivorans aminofermentans]MBE6011425.1 cyclodeaminase/cyclohydrolase family protein [Lachnospiraceae bacterium]
MKLVDHTIKEFAKVLASDAPAPGGGSTAALEGALGVALTHMVAGLTVGKPKYQEHEELMKELMEKSDKILCDFIDVIDRDTEAFNVVSAVFSMPKSTDEEKAARKNAMQEGLKGCTLTPFEMMSYSLAGLELTYQALGKFNESAASDLGVAALSLKAAVQGAWLNVKINIGGIKDEAFVNEYRTKGEEILKRSIELADEIYARVLEML